MPIEAIQSLIAAFGAGIDLPELALDSQGYCALGFDELEVHLQFDQQTDDLLAFSSLGQLNDAARPRACELLLHANLFWSGTNGATLALQPGDHTVMLHDRQATTTLDEARLNQWLHAFVTSAEQWSGIVAELNERGAEEPDDPAPQNPTPPPPTSGMLQV